MKKSYVLTIDTDIITDGRKWLAENGLSIVKKLAEKVAVGGISPKSALLELIDEGEISGSALVIHAQYALDILVSRFNSVLAAEIFEDGDHE